MSWITKAAEQFPVATRFIGDGRWACSTADGTVVYLAATEQQQLAICLGIEKPRRVDLKFPTCPVPTKCTDIGYDREERRREHEERRGELQ